MDVSEIFSKRLNAKKEVIFPKQGEIIFPIADGGRIFIGGAENVHLDTVDVRGEDQQGEKRSPIPPPHDSFLDAGEAINYFWSMSGNFIYRHHVSRTLPAERRIIPNSTEIH